ncbi:hypothetical protein NPIL_304131 [Nephila pilipes]|uniref:Protein kinase domain-containing protein n=1 Tax=Nephila pilipes TaxID=299642 RepID=A0A8X6Q574_NEPPI|nr:hypothetical protein NPIL_304131 [Nephila pilipes]
MHNTSRSKFWVIDKMQIMVDDLRDNQKVAIKTIKKAKIESEEDMLRIRREIHIMASIRHPYIIHINEVFETRQKIVIVMQYASGGELYDYLGCHHILPEEEARRLFRQIAAAIYYCHKNKICHRDLKLENILLDEKGNALIADFGLSNIFDDRRRMNTFCGSPLYASPEIVKGTPYKGPEPVGVEQTPQRRTHLLQPPEKAPDRVVFSKRRQRADCYSTLTSLSEGRYLRHHLTEIILKYDTCFR